MRSLWSLRFLCRTVFVADSPELKPAGNADLERLRAASPSRAADLISEVFGPTVVVPLVLLAVSFASASPLAALGWALLTALFCVAIPLAVLTLLVRRGAVGDRHLVRRDQRGVPLLVAVCCYVVGTAALLGLGAPKPVCGLVVAMFAALVAATVISHWHKISVHAGVVANTGVVLAQVFGPTALVVMLPVLAAVSWARVRAGRHTVGQVVAGIVIAAAAAAIAFPLST